MLLSEAGDRRDPYVSALYGELAGLPPLYLQVSDAETLLDDSRALAERARNAGVEVRLDVFPSQQHTFQMAAGRSAVADEAIGRMADWSALISGCEAALPTLLASRLEPI
jgi:monoterpene epsilon-lactone hydrolase